MQRTHDCAHARPADEIDRDSDFSKRPKHSYVSETPRSPAAQNQAHRATHDPSRQPLEVFSLSDLNVMPCCYPAISQPGKGAPKRGRCPMQENQDKVGARA